MTSGSIAANGGATGTTLVFFLGLCLASAFIWLLMRSANLCDVASAPSPAAGSSCNGDGVTDEERESLSSVEVDARSIPATMASESLATAGSAAAAAAPITRVCCGDTGTRCCFCC